jgi:hypothetical protein
LNLFCASGAIFFFYNLARGGVYSPVIFACLIFINYYI